MACIETDSSLNRLTKEKLCQKLLSRASLSAIKNTKRVCYKPNALNSQKRIKKKVEERKISMSPKAERELNEEIPFS